MQILPDPNYDYIKIDSSEHPTYWIRFWAPPVEPGRAWRAEPMKVVEALDVNEVLEWARSDGRLFELSVEALNFSGETSRVVIAGYPADRPEADPEAFVSDPAERLKWQRHVQAQ